MIPRYWISDYADNIVEVPFGVLYTAILDKFFGPAAETAHAKERWAFIRNTQNSRIIGFKDEADALYFKLAIAGG